MQKTKGLWVLTAFLVLTAACQKTDDQGVVPKPPDTDLPAESVEYTDLTGKEIKRGEGLALDLNKDGIRDFVFGTQLVGDPFDKVDKVQYTVLSGVDSYLPINAEESIARFRKGEEIPISNFGGFIWYRISFSVLAQKIISETKPPYWEGDWKASRHDFLPVQVYKDQKRYAGWIELSFDTLNETLIFHRAAISKTPERSLKAGI